ncbi:hypothetical protein Hamer_G003945, partial [Homarus americanus]
MKREAVPQKCNRITIEDDSTVAGEGLEKLQLEDQDLRPVVDHVKSLQERLTEVHHPVRGALELSGEVMKRNRDVKANQVCYENDVTYRIRVRRKAQPKVVHVNSLWQYHGPWQYTWEDSEEQPPTTDGVQTGYPGRTQGCTDPESPTMDQEEEH